MNELEAQKALAVAERRVGSIGRMLKSGTAFLPARKVSRNIIRDLVDGLVKDMKVEGLDNIDRAKKMKSQSKGRIIMAGNHSSTGDIATRRHGYETNGRHDIANGTIYIAGFNVAETSRHLFPSENALMMVSPKDLEVAKSLKRLLLQGGDIGQMSNKDAKKMIDAYLEAARSLNKLAISDIERFVTGDRFLFAFLEGTRSRDPEGRMAKAHHGTQGLLTHDEDILVPVYEDGARLFMTPGKPLFEIGGRGFAKGWIKPGRYTVEMAIGEPVIVGELRERAKRVFNSKREGGIVDIAQYQIWKLRPDRVAPEYHPLRDKLFAAGV